MLGPAEISQGVGDDANRLPCSATPTDPISKVLDDDDLLIEIMVRLGFPTTLVRAALVCKRWYHHASGPAFLRRFRKLHPPRLLGFYVNTGEEWDPARFVQMLPPPPELASVFSHASFSLDAYKKGWPYVMDCWKNSVLVHLVCYNGSRKAVKAVHSPFFPERGIAVVPPSPQNHLSGGNKTGSGHLLVKEEGGSLSYLYVFIETTFNRTESTVHIYLFQDVVWRRIISATTKLPCELKQKPLLVDNRIYILASPCGILVFDLRALTFSTVQFPDGVVCGLTMNPLGPECGARTRLLPADDDSGVYLIYVNELQLVIWLYEGGNWLLVDTICLREICAVLSISDSRFANGINGSVEITRVGPDAEFVLLETPRCTLFWDIKCRTLRILQEITRTDISLRRIHPFMMIWPPSFPALKDSPARFTFCSF